MGRISNLGVHSLSAQQGDNNTPSAFYDWGVKSSGRSTSLLGVAVYVQFSLVMTEEKSSAGFLWTVLKTHDCNSVQFDYFDNSLTVYSFLSPLSIRSHIKFLVNNIKQILSNGTADHMAAFTAKQPQEMQHVRQFKCYFY